MSQLAGTEDLIQVNTQAAKINKTDSDGESHSHATALDNTLTPPAPYNPSVVTPHPSSAERTHVRERGFFGHNEHCLIIYVDNEMDP